MPSFPLHFQPHEYEVAPGQRLLAMRPFAALIIPSCHIQPACFVDTGAPFSIISHSIARISGCRRMAVRNPIRVYVNGVFDRTATANELLTWNGIPCELGELSAVLVETTLGIQSAPLRIAGKIAQQPVKMFHDRFVILGLSFFSDNLAEFSLAGMPWNISGTIDVP